VRATPRGWGAFPTRSWWRGMPASADWRRSVPAGHVLKRTGPYRGSWTDATRRAATKARVGIRHSGPSRRSRGRGWDQDQPYNVAWSAKFSSSRYCLGKQLPDPRTDWCDRGRRHRAVTTVHCSHSISPIAQVNSPARVKSNRIRSIDSMAVPLLMSRPPPVDCSEKFRQIHRGGDRIVAPSPYPCAWAATIR
jgi:hypothetical protein